MTRASRHRLRFGILFPAVVGFFASLWLTYIHIRVHTDPMYDAACAFGSHMNCTAVAAAPLSVIAGIPLAVIGAVFYLILALTTAFSAYGRNLRNTGIITLMGASAAAISLALIVVGTVWIGAVCPGCLLVHAVNFFIAFQCFRLFDSPRSAISAAGEDVRALLSNKWSLAQIAALLMLLVVAGPLGGFPRYWAFSAWISGVSIPTGVISKDDHPWIGAENPTTVIHEFFDYECPACRSSHRKIRKLLVSRSDTVRLVRHDMSRVPCIDPMGHPIPDQCVAAKAAYCAAMENRFWEFSDAFMADPRPQSLFDRNAHVLDLVSRIGLDENRVAECMHRPETVQHVQGVFDDGMGRGIKSTPTYFVDGKMMKSKELIPLLRSL